MKSSLPRNGGFGRLLSLSLVKRLKKFIHIFSAAAMTAVFLLPAPMVQAVTAAPWAGEEVVRSHNVIRLKPGADITFEIHFKNTGTQTWRAGGANFVAIATQHPEKRKSLFEHSYWDAEYRPSLLRNGDVKPGGTAIFRFPFHAPDKEGEYVETFQAVAKNLAWIPGTKFTVNLIVTNTPEQPANHQTITTQQTVPSDELAPSTTKASPDAAYTISEDYPIQDKGYAAQWQGGQKLTLEAEAGAQVLQTLTVKNAGTKTWASSGGRFVSAYTVRPNYHNSVFYVPGPGWIDATQIRLATAEVKPGQIGEIKVLLQAPSKAGTYQEQIRLAAENHTWIKGGELHLELIVKEKPVEQPEKQPAAQEENAADEGVKTYLDDSFAAQFLISSGASLRLQPGQAASFKVGFKNIGDAIWKKSGPKFVSMYTIDPNYRLSRFATTRVAAESDGWLSASQIALKDSEVRPGQIGYFEFTLTAPSTPGSYTEKFHLAAEDHTWIKGGEFALPITVENPATAPIVQKPSGNTGNLGPIMRVGLFESDAPFSITADSPFEVRSGGGQLLASLPAKTEVSISYDRATGNYTAQSAVFSKTMADYIVVQALDNFTIMEILSYERRLPWNPAVNENLFRGSIEIRHSAKTGDTWAINILPMEQYLKGIAETSSNSSVEFLKVMTLAARTYATYHYERQTKHADKHFYVDSDYDQVYRGYALEKRHPSLAEAVDLTTGEVITYTDPQTREKRIAITPYFSRSDGRTRDWSEVWGGEVPWAKSVPVPHDQGKTLLGHGVGMSARGALLMVEEDGMSYQQVLKYFFQGIEIEDRY